MRERNWQREKTPVQIHDSNTGENKTSNIKPALINAEVKSGSVQLREIIRMYDEISRGFHGSRQVCGADRDGRDNRASQQDFQRATHPLSVLAKRLRR